MLLDIRSQLFFCNTSEKNSDEYAFRISGLERLSLSCSCIVNLKYQAHRLLSSSPKCFLELGRAGKHAQAIFIPPVKPGVTLVKKKRTVAKLTFCNSPGKHFDNKLWGFGWSHVAHTHRLSSYDPARKS